MTEYKLVILGSGGVGKSMLLFQLIKGYFLDAYDPTIEDSYRKQVTVDNETCLLDVLDTAGGEDYTKQRDHFMRTGHGFLCMYAITSRCSFEQLDAFPQMIRRIRGPVAVPMVFVGNKCDLESARQVPSSEGHKYAAQYDSPYFETSAKERINVEEAFFGLVRQIWKLSGTPEENRRHVRPSKSSCLLL
jgi:GTPase KRas protein